METMRKTGFVDKYNMCREYLQQGDILSKPKFMISDEGNDHQTVNEIQDTPLIGFKVEDFSPVHLDISKLDDVTVKEEIAEICMFDTKEWFEPIVKKENENTCICNLCCLGFTSEECLKEHLAKCLHEAAEEYSSEAMPQCSACDIYFTSRKYLESHMEHCGDHLTKAAFSAVAAEVEALKVSRRIVDKTLAAVETTTRSQPGNQEDIVYDNRGNLRVRLTLSLTLN